MKNQDESDPQFDNFGRNLFILLMAFFLSLKFHSNAMPIQNQGSGSIVNVISTK